MKAHKIKSVPAHRLMHADPPRRRVEHAPRLSPMFLRFHPGVTFAEDRGQPRTSMEAALRQVGF